MEKTVEDGKAPKTNPKVPSTAEVSSEEDELVNAEEHELSDYKEDDDFEGWDGRSVSSSMIFPNNNNNNGKSGAPTSRRRLPPRESATGPSSRSTAQDHNNDDNRGAEHSDHSGSNLVEDLVKERVGAEESKIVQARQ